MPEQPQTAMNDAKPKRPAKPAARRKAPAPKPAARKVPPKVPPKPAPKPTARIPVKRAEDARLVPAQNKAEPGARRTQATVFICNLIMENFNLHDRDKRTDDQIFDLAKEKFALNENRRPMVAWYRGQLRREGVANVPAAYRRYGES